MLTRHIESQITDTVEHIILWSDSCGGQNRNIRISLMMMHLLQNHEHLKTITFKFRVSGHSFLPNDSDFGDVECAMRHQQRLYLPEYIIKVMKQSRRFNKFVVSRRNRSDFIGIGTVEAGITNRKVSISGEAVSWLNTREIKLEKGHPQSLFMRSDFIGVQGMGVINRCKSSNHNYQWL